MKITVNTVTRHSNIPMFKKFFRKKIPAPDGERSKLARDLFNFRLNNDMNYVNYWYMQMIDTDSISYEDIMTFQEGILIKMTEQHLVHMDTFESLGNGMSREQYEATHIEFLNDVHSSMFQQIGHQFPASQSISSIKEYIVYFFDNMPEEIAVKFPSNMVSTSVEIVKDFYAR